MASHSPSTSALARIDALAAEGAPSLEAVGDAVVRADYDQASMLALARAFAGEVLPVEAVVPILPGVEALVTLLALVKASSGRRSEALIKLVRKNGLPAETLRRGASAFVLYVAWRLKEGDAVRQQIAPPFRKLLRQQWDPRALALLARIVRELDDLNVTSLAEDLVPAFLLDHDATLELTGGDGRVAG